VVVTEDAHRYTPVHVPPAAERGGCGQAGSGWGGHCGSSSRAVAAAAGRRLRAPVAVTSIALYRQGGCIGGRRGKGTRHPMPGLCAGPRRYQVWRTGAGGTGIMTGGTGPGRRAQ
jgi:hypothetical protein